MHVKASDIGKFMEVIYELLKNFTWEHRMSNCIILLFKWGEPIPKTRMAKKSLFLDLEIDILAFKSYAGAFLRKQQRHFSVKLWGGSANRRSSSNFDTLPHAEGTCWVPAVSAAPPKRCPEGRAGLLAPRAVVESKGETQSGLRS